MENLIPVEGSKNLFRDKITGAIVNYDSAGYSQYIKAKTNKKKEKEEIEKLKSDIDEIKILLKQILEGKNGN